MVHISSTKLHLHHMAAARAYVAVGVSRISQPHSQIFIHAPYLLAVHGECGLEYFNILSISNDCNIK